MHLQEDGERGQMPKFGKSRGKKEESSSNRRVGLTCMPDILIMSSSLQLITLRCATFFATKI